CHQTGGVLVICVIRLEEYYGMYTAPPESSHVSSMVRRGAYVTQRRADHEQLTPTQWPLSFPSSLSLALSLSLLSLQKCIYLNSFLLMLMHASLRGRSWREGLRGARCQEG